MVMNGHISFSPLYTVIIYVDNIMILYFFQAYVRYQLLFKREVYTFISKCFNSIDLSCVLPFFIFFIMSNGAIMVNYIEPDISVICDLFKLDEKGCHGAPDWIIEIVSPGNKPMDYFTKLFKYRNANVREYWIVDPTKEQIMVYRFEMETMEQYSFADDVPVGIYDDFSICIQQF